MENLNILNLSGILLFCFVIFFGYFSIEIILKDKYPYRYIFDKYENNLFDRILNYIIVGFIVSVAWFIFIHYIGIGDIIIKASTNITNILKEFIGEGKQDKVNAILVIYSIWYSFTFMLVYYISILSFKIGNIIGEKIGKIIIKKMPRRK